MDSLFQDIRQGVRGLLKFPMLTSVAVFALALGIGANTALFSVVNAILIRSIPVKEVNSLTIVWETNPKMASGPREGNEVAEANLMDWKASSQSFEDFAAFWFVNFNLTHDGEPERLFAAIASPNLFSVIGVQPIRGRGFLPEEENPGKNRVAVLSYSLWQRSFGGDPNIVDQTILLNGVASTVIGVMPAHFDLQFPTTRQIDLWLPFVTTPEGRSDRSTHFLYVLGRVKQGVSLDQAQSEMSMISGELERQYPNTNLERGVKLVPLREYIVGGIRPALLIAMAAVAIVLLIACANVANLLLGRIVARQREIALRSALGATRSRLIRQFLTESMLMSVMSGVVGLLLAYLAIRAIVNLSPPDIPRIKETGLDLPVLAFTFMVSLLTGLVYGLVPAFKASRADINESLKEGGIGATAGAISGRLRSALVISEIGLSLMLLIAGGLMVRSFRQLLQKDPGFEPNGALTFQVALPRARYAEPEKIVPFFRQLLERLQILPGVRVVGGTSILPLAGSNETNGFAVEGRSQLDNKGNEANYRVITPGYFSAMGITMLEGRDFTDADADKATDVVIINEALARRFFPNQEPIGKLIRITDGKEAWRQIVGVVSNTRQSRLSEDAKPEMYVAFAQKPIRALTLVIRSDTRLESLISSMRNEVRSVDRDLPIFSLKTMNDLIWESVAKQRFNMLLLSILAGLALVLAIVGLYSLMAFLVGQRSHEIGIRMALGAQRRDITSLVVGQAAKLMLPGIAIGLISAFVLTRLLSTLLYEVSPTDPITFLFAPLILGSVAILASYFPARRAARVDPLIVLRYE